tara:strand:- start:3210 stop:4010 length:801 start_codon:yes stop_codon:yes gene_type:complete
MSTDDNLLGTTNTSAGMQVGQDLGYDETLAEYAGDYVTDMLGQGKALGNQQYPGYGGPLTAGESGLQQQAFQGLASLNPSSFMGDYTSQSIGNYMNPYLEQALQPQVDAAIRQANIRNVSDASKLNQAGAYGGSRQAVLQAESNRGLQDSIAEIYGEGYQKAFDKAVGMQDTMRNFGLDALQAQQDAGGIQRDIEQEGIDADMAQFDKEFEFPYKQVQFMQSLLQGLPIEARESIYSQPGLFGQGATGASILMEILNAFPGGEDKK